MTINQPNKTKDTASAAEPFLFLGLKPELFVSVMATVIALVSLLATLYTIAQNQEQNRLSTRPYLTFDYIAEFGADRFFVAVKNAGPGAGIIRETKVFLDGELQTDSAGYYGLVTALKTLGLDDPFISTLVYDPGDVMAPEDRSDLIFLNNPKTPPLLKKKLKAAFERINIVMTYESFYQLPYTGCLHLQRLECPQHAKLGR